MKEQRKKLLEAALVEFSEAGLSGASLESIARRADLSPSVVRALFVDKERLFKAVLEEWTGPLISAIGLAVAGIEDAGELMRMSLRILDEWLLDNPQYVRLLLWSALEEARNLDSIYERSFFPSEFYERMEKYVNAGRIRGRDAFLTGLLLDSLILFPHMIRDSLELMCPHEASEEFFERRFQAVMDLLEHGLFNK